MMELGYALGRSRGRHQRQEGRSSRSTRTSSRPTSGTNRVVRRRRRDYRDWFDRHSELPPIVEPSASSPTDYFSCTAPQHFPPPARARSSGRGRIRQHAGQSDCGSECPDLAANPQSGPVESSRRTSPTTHIWSLSAHWTPLPHMHEPVYNAKYSPPLVQQQLGGRSASAPVVRANRVLISTTVDRSL